MLLNKFFAIILLLVLSGCGYKPASYYAKELVGGKVFVESAVSLEDPKNSVIVKDTLIEILTSKLHANITTNKNDADLVMNSRLDSVAMSELGYDNKGYIRTYRASVNITINYISTKKSGAMSVGGSYDFSLDDTSTISETKRFEAIKIASQKAMSDFVSKVGVQFFK